MGISFVREITSGVKRSISHARAKKIVRFEPEADVEKLNYVCKHSE
jgi:hypothetical protein